MCPWDSFRSIALLDSVSFIFYIARINSGIVSAAAGRFKINSDISETKSCLRDLLWYSVTKRILRVKIVQRASEIA